MDSGSRSISALYIRRGEFEGGSCREDPDPDEEDFILNLIDYQTPLSERLYEDDEDDDDDDLKFLTFRTLVDH
eukprot:13794455-Heterocapsa_arctica.AAC.1